MEENQRGIVGVIDFIKGFGITLFHHQHPPWLLEPGGRHNLFFRLLFRRHPVHFQYADLDARMPGLQGYGRPVHNTASQPWAGLKKPFLVYEIHFPGFADSHVFNQGSKGLGIHSRPQDPLLSFLLLGDGYDKVGHLAESREHVTDVKTLFHNLLEPKCVHIVFVHEVVRADVGYMITFLVNNPQIRYGAVLVIHGFEDMGQVVHLAEKVLGMGLRNELKFGCGLSDKQLNDPFVVFHLSLKSTDHASLGESSVVDVDRPAHQQQGNNRANQSDQNEPPVELGIVFLPPDLLAFLFDAGLARIHVDPFLEEPPQCRPIYPRLITRGLSITYLFKIHAKRKLQGGPIRGPETKPDGL